MKQNFSVALFFCLFFWVVSSNLLAFGIQFQSVDHEKLTRLVFLADGPFEYEVVAEDDRTITLFVDREIHKFEFLDPVQQSRFIENISYEAKKGRSRIFIRLKSPFSLVRHFYLKVPFRVVIDLNRYGDQLKKPRVSTPALTEKQEDLNNLLKKYRYLMEETFKDEGKLNAAQALLNVESPMPSKTDMENILSSREAHLLKNDIGLKLIGDYAYNSSLGITDVDEGPYKWRTRVGVDWDLLRDGLLKRKRQKKLLKKQMEVEDLQSIMDKRRENYYYLRNLIIYLFSQDKIRNLEKRKKILRELLVLSRRKYFQNRIFLEETIKLERDLARVENLLDNYLKYRKEFVTYSDLNAISITSSDLPVVSIDIDALLKELDMPPGLSEILRLNQEQVNLKYSFWKDVRLKLWLYYYYYNRVVTTNNFFSMGVQINIPFPFSLQSRREIKKAESELFRTKFERMVHANVLEAMNSYDEYKYKMDDLINFLNKRRILQVRLKRAQIEHEFGARRISYWDVLNIVKQLLEVDYEIYHIRQEMYLRMIKMFRNYGGKNIGKFLRKANLGEFQRIDIYRGKRYLYVWSRSFNDLDNEFFIQFLKVREIDNVLISVGKATNMSKLKAFLERAAQKHIAVYALFSSNQWINPSHFHEIKTRLSITNRLKFRGVHIDIEPHTLPDWNRHMKKYMSNYQKMLEIVKSHLQPEQELSVAIPFSSYNAYSRIVFPLVDRVFVMVYGSSNFDVKKIKRKMGTYIKDYRDRIVITLRPADFKDELEMEDFIDRLFESGYFGAFAFHDIEKLLRVGG